MNENNTNPATNEAINLPKPTDLLSVALQTYKQKLKLFGGILLLPLILLIISEIPKLINVPIHVNFIFLVILWILFVFVSYWTQAALIYANAHKDEHITPKDAYVMTKGKILKLWWVNMLTASLFMIGILLFVIPAFLMTIWFALSSFIVVLENIGGLNALIRSREYMRGIFGKVFVHYGFLILIALVVSFVFAPLDKLIKTKIVGDVVVYLFLVPVFSTYLYNLYSTVKTYKGNIDYTISTGRKAWYIVGIVIGAILFIAFIALYFLLLSMFGNTNPGINAVG